MSDGGVEVKDVTSTKSVEDADWRTVRMALAEILSLLMACGGCCYYHIESPDTTAEGRTCAPANGEISVEVQNVDPFSIEDALITMAVPEVEVPEVREYVEKNAVVRRAMLRTNCLDVRRELMAQFKKEILDYALTKVVILDPNRPVVIKVDNEKFKATFRGSVSRTVPAPHPTPSREKKLHKKPTFLTGVIMTLLTTLAYVLRTMGAHNLANTTAAMTTVQHGSVAAILLSVLYTLIAAAEHTLEQ